MAGSKKSLGTPQPGPQLDSQYGYPERTREGGHVMGSADGEYGYVDGFHYGITSTGDRHKKSDLGRRVKG